MKIIPLSEGAFTVDASKKFIPFELSEDKMANRSKGSLLVEIQPFVVITNNDVILLDTGLGLTDADGQFQIYKNLRNNNINTTDITKVVMSHLHKDHSGGLFNPYTQQPAFENATIYIQKQELDFATETASSSYNAQLLDVLNNYDNVILNTSEKGEIDNTISYEVTGAHSKFHRVIWIRENDETIFFGADDAPQFSQMKTRFAAKYDYDGKKAMILREKWMEEGLNWKFLFYHDIKTPIKQFGQ